MKALFINCILKRKLGFSNTGALADKAAKHHAATRDLKRKRSLWNDYNMLTGNSSDEGGGDKWPLILDVVIQ